MAPKNHSSLNGKGLAPASFRAIAVSSVLSLATTVAALSSGIERQGYSPSPNPTAEAYHVQVRTSFTDGEPQTAIIFLKGEKVLGTNEIECGFERDSGGGSKRSGRSFFIFRKKEEYKLFVFEKTGRKILETSGIHAVLSANGRFLIFEAYPQQTGANAQRIFVLHDFSFHSERKVPIESPGLPRAITDDGKQIVLWDSSPNSWQGRFFIMDEEGKTIWAKNGPYRLEGISSQGNRICFTNTKLMVTEICDLGSGQILLKIPFFKWKLLNPQF